MGSYRWLTRNLFARSPLPQQGRQGCALTKQTRKNRHKLFNGLEKLNSRRKNLFDIQVADRPVLNQRVRITMRNRRIADDFVFSGYFALPFRSLDMLTTLPWEL